MLFTASDDGFLKFWKKGQVGVEFIKSFKAHTCKVSGMALTSDELRVATVCGQERSIKLFDTLNFDVIHFLRLDFSPGVCEFVTD